MRDDEREPEVEADTPRVSDTVIDAVIDTLAARENDPEADIKDDLVVELDGMPPELEMLGENDTLVKRDCDLEPDADTVTAAVGDMLFVLLGEAPNVSEGVGYTL